MEIGNAHLLGAFLKYKVLIFFKCKYKFLKYVCVAVCINCVFMLEISPFVTQITGKTLEMFETMSAEYKRLFPTLPNSVLGD